MIWRVVLSPDGEVRLYRHSTVTPRDMVLGGADEMMLVVTEVAEAMEDLRDGKMALSYDENGKPTGFPIEIADVMIRLFGLAGYLRIDLDDAVDTKIAFNETRPHRHGGKLA